MKKFLRAAFLMMLAVIMTSCSSSPSDCAANFLESVKQEDSELLKNPEDEFAYAMAVETFNHRTRKGLDSYEILGEEIEDGGREAFVNVKVVYGTGKKQEKKLRYVKSSNGWKLDGETFRYW